MNNKNKIPIPADGSAKGYALVARPGFPFEWVECEGAPDSDWLRNQIDGSAEHIPVELLPGVKTVMVVNREGRLLGLSENVAATMLMHCLEEIVGTAVILIREGRELVAIKDDPGFRKDLMRALGEANFMARNLRSFESKKTAPAWLDVEGISARYGVGKSSAYNIIVAIREACGGGKLPTGKVLMSEVLCWESAVKAAGGSI